MVVSLNTVPYEVFRTVEEQGELEFATVQACSAGGAHEDGLKVLFW